jgi:hypothetical protein
MNSETDDGRISPMGIFWSALIGGFGMGLGAAWLLSAMTGG